MTYIYIPLYITPQALDMPIIGRSQKAALLEAYAVTISLLPPPLRAEFLIIGGTSLVMLGSTRNTQDIDFAVSAMALNAFEQAACQDNRFAKGHVADWTYTCQEEGTKDLVVPLEFLQMGGGFAPVIKVVKPADGGFRPSMGELARMKAYAYMARSEESDLEDLRFLLSKSGRQARNFKE